MKLISLTMIRRIHLDEDEIEVEDTCPVTIIAEKIRSFNPRRDGKAGARITFDDGGGFAVRETPDAIAAELSAV
jgi:hypothetical protein